MMYTEETKKTMIELNEKYFPVLYYVIDAIGCTTYFMVFNNNKGQVIFCYENGNKSIQKIEN